MGMEMLLLNTDTEDMVTMDTDMDTGHTAMARNPLDSSSTFGSATLLPGLSFFCLIPPI